MAAEMPQHQHYNDVDYGYERFRDPPGRHQIHNDVPSDSEPSRGQSSSQNTDDGGKVKKIHVTTTGPFPKQKPFVCNRFVKSYSKFLDEIRERLGCDQSIRCLRSPGGTRVRSLENLRGNNTVYTALCPNDLVRQALGPLPPHLPPPLRPSRRPRHEWIPRSNVYNYVPSRVLDENNYRCRSIYVYLNGEFHRRPHRILIDRRLETMNRPFDMLLKYTEEKVVNKNTRPCVVRKLYDLNTGRAVKDISELMDGMTLVACPQFERLIIGDYGRLDRPMNCGKPPSSKQRAFLSKTPTPPEGKQRFGGSSSDASPRHDFEASQINPLAPLPPIGKRSVRSEPQPARSELQDDFKAKKPNEATQGAEEVKETKDTVTDLPVDQKKAEEVEEDVAAEPEPSEAEKPASNEDDDAEMNAAATKVQANFRGYQTRKNMANRKANEEPHEGEQQQTEKEPAKEEAAPEESPKAEDPQTEPPVEIEDEEEAAKAATKIQAGFRGYKTRKDMKTKAEEQQKKEEDQNEKEAAAATKIQAGYRGHRTRKEMNAKKAEGEKKEEEKTPDDQEELDKAATKIQAGFRGHQARKQLKEQQNDKTEDAPPAENEAEPPKEGEDDDEAMNKAATKIQAGFRGYQTRQQLQSNKKQDEPENAEGEAPAAEGEAPPADDSAKAEAQPEADAAPAEGSAG